MRNLLLSGLALLALGVARPAAAADPPVPAPIWKLARGIVNVAIGFPGEMLVHTVGTATEGYGSTAGSTLAGIGAGAATGFGWGVVRVGSGLFDVFTFPVPYDDNRPLLLPEFPL